MPPPCACEDCCDDHGQRFTGHWDGKKGRVVGMFRAAGRRRFEGKHWWVEVTPRAARA